MAKPTKLTLTHGDDKIALLFSKRTKALVLTLDEAEKIGFDMYMRAKILKQYLEPQPAIILPENINNIKLH